MATPPLFRIPRELRDRVYHFALYNQRAEFFTANLSLRVRYLEDEGNLEPFDSRHNVNFRWLLTSRQVLSEGLEQFYAHATLDFYCIWENDWNPDLTLDGTTSIFDLRRVKNAELALQLGKAHHEKDDCIYDLVVPRGKERSRLNDEDFAELGKVLKSVGKCAFEHLKLRVWLFRTENRTKEYEDTGNRWRGDFGVPEDDVASNDAHTDEDDDFYSVSSSEDSYNEMYWNGYGTNLSVPDEIDGYLVDFSFLQNLGTTWKHVQIQYVPTFMLGYFGDGDPIPANILGVPIVQEGLAGIAKGLVSGGDDGAGWAVRDRLELFPEHPDDWIVDAERREGGDRVGELKEVGFKSFLAECEGCGKREETFRLQDDKRDGIIRFAGVCGKVVEVETPVFRMEE